MSSTNCKLFIIYQGLSRKFSSCYLLGSCKWKIHETVINCFKLCSYQQISYGRL